MFSGEFCLKWRYSKKKKHTNTHTYTRTRSTFIHPFLITLSNQTEKHQSCIVNPIPANRGGPSWNNWNRQKSTKASTTLITQKNCGRKISTAIYRDQFLTTNELLQENPPRPTKIKSTIQLKSKRAHQSCCQTVDSRITLSNTLSWPSSQITMMTSSVLALIIRSVTDNTARTRTKLNASRPNHRASRLAPTHNSALHNHERDAKLSQGLFLFRSVTLSYQYTNTWHPRPCL